VNILNFPERKKNHEPIVMVTCYDYTMASIIAESPVDMVLVGDSAAMVVHGHDTTLPISVEEMAVHVRAVRRGAPDKFIVADLPFMSCRKGLEPAMTAVEKLMKAGAEAVKLEGIRGQEKLVRHIVDSGIPVMGHLGLTPQSVKQLGGFRVQGRSADDRDRLRREARACQDAGCFSLVLECVPESLAAEITRSLDIVTVGIGAGQETDGQVLVLHDLLGLTPGKQPRFVRTFMDGRSLVLAALDEFAHDVRRGSFPAPAERYAG
jgi:3-methyl-2-oxobutanoate hydroxymethyltransferase